MFGAASSWVRSGPIRLVELTDRDPQIHTSVVVRLRDVEPIMEIEAHAKPGLVNPELLA